MCFIQLTRELFACICPDLEKQNLLIYHHWNVTHFQQQLIQISRAIQTFTPFVLHKVGSMHGFFTREGVYIFQESGSDCLYKVELQTRSIYGSGSEWLKCCCFFDRWNGDSILQRIPASLIREHSNQLEDNVVSDVLHFQRGSLDEFTFEGPKLGKIEALWIGVESG